LNILTDANMQKLVRCEIKNCKGEPSTRWVEMYSFKLWRYMMVHKHKIEISKSQPSMWMRESDFQEKQSTLEHSGRIARVDGIVVSIFHKNNNFVEKIIRFSDREYSGKFKEILLSHVTEEMKEKKNIEIEEVSGISIIRYGEVDDLYLGLDDTICI
jgi:hypothetical protein